MCPVQSATPEELLPALRQWGGHSLAWSALQPGMQYFGDATLGFLAVRRRLGCTLVLGDPIAPAAQKGALLDAFLKAHGTASFMQVSESTANLLRERGYFATPVGVENEIDTATFTLVGHRKRDLRHYRNKALAGGIRVAEECDTPELRRALKPVSDSWLPLKSRGARELEFLARPFSMEPEPGVRIFTGRRNGVPEGFVVLDPMYLDGRLRGYVVTILRHARQAPEGTVDYINLQVIEQLRQEGVPVLSLGVSPFHEIETMARASGMGLPPVYLSFLTMRRFGTPIYHFRGLSFHKSRYRAREVPVFTCARGPLGLWPLLAAARACRMV